MSGTERATHGPFAWWDTHHRVWRRARLLLVLSAGVLAVYVAFLVAGLALLAHTAGIEPFASDLESRLDDAPVRLAVLGGALLALGALAILGTARNGLGRFVIRLSGARPPDPGEGDRPERRLDAFAVAYGMPTPRLWIIDDPAPNALAFGRPRAGHVALTRGALELGDEELEALCSFEVSALASRAHAYAVAAADLILLGEWLTRVLWAASGFVLLSTIIGVPIEPAAVYSAALFVLVVTTRPLFVVTDRALVRLIDDTTQLVDLETTRRSARPADLAHLLLAMLEDRRRIASRWEVAHLWFERDVQEIAPGSDHAVVTRTWVFGRPRREPRPPPPRRRFITALTDIVRECIGVLFIPDSPSFAARCAQGSRRDLLDRAQVAANLANADSRLRGRLRRARAEAGSTGIR